MSQGAAGMEGDVREGCSGHSMRTTEVLEKGNKAKSMPRAWNRKGRAWQGLLTFPLPFTVSVFVSASAAEFVADFTWLAFFTFRQDSLGGRVEEKV